MARGGGYCCKCIVEVLFCALLSVSLIAVLFLVYLVFLNQDFYHPDTFKTLCIAAIWHFFGTTVSILGLYGVWMNKPVLLNIGSYYFYLNGIQLGFYSVTLILLKINPAWKRIVSYNEPLFLNLLLKTMLGDKRLIITISHLISTVASFYFALIIRSCRENMSRKNGRPVAFQETIELDTFQNPEIINSHIHMREYCKYIKQIGITILFCALLGIFWIAVISLGYIAIYRPQDFISMKPLKPERYPFSYDVNKSAKCEHYEYFADFQSDKPFQNIWITFIWSIIGVVVSTTTMYGIVMENPYFLDPGSIYLFIYATHKGFVAGMLFLFNCPPAFLFKFLVLTEPSVAFLSILDVAVSIKSIHLILMAMAVCLLMLVTDLRNNVVRKKLKNIDIGEKF